MSISLKQAWCKVAEWCETPPWSTEDCAPSYPVYKMSDRVLGVNVRRWLEPPDAVPHAAVDTIWTGPADPTTGFPTHINSPTTEAVESDFTVAGPDNQIEAWAWVDIPQDGFLRDINGNTGELGEVWIAPCCQTPARQPGYADTINTGSAGTDRYVMDVVPISAGMQLVYFRGSDLSANQGVAIQYSVDGVNNWIQPEWVTELPTVECVIVDGCDPVPAGYDLCYPTQCKPVLGPPSTSEPVVIPDLQVARCEDALDYEWNRGFRGQIVSVTATDFNTDILGWVVEGSYTVPCDGAYHIELDLPWVRSIVRDAFLQVYFEYQLLVNGAVLQNLPNFALLEHTEYNTTENNSLHYADHNFEIDWSRQLDAGDVVTTQWRAKGRRLQPGDNPYARFLVYKSRLIVIGSASPVVTGVQYAP